MRGFSRSRQWSLDRCGLVQQRAYPSPLAMSHGDQAMTPPEPIQQDCCSRRLFYFQNRWGTGYMEKDKEAGLDRRNLLKKGGAIGAALLFEAAHQLLPSGAFAATPGPETKTAKLGFIALTDAAPVILAKELGLFAKYGMPDVVVAKQASWGATRDNLVLGSGGGGIDGAHILSPLPYLLTLGAAGKATPMNILARLNVNGQGISVEK